MKKFLCLVVLLVVAFVSLAGAAALTGTAALGTKGSVTITPSGISSITYACRTVGATTPYTAKVYVNSVTSNFLTGSYGVLTAGTSSGRALQTVTFKAYSSATQAECGYIGL